MGYVTTSGTQFILNGRPFLPFGATIYDDLYFPSRFPAKFDACVAMGLNMVRFVNFLTIAATANIEFSESVWVIIDQCLEYCRARGLKVLLDLSDFNAITTARGYVCFDANWLTQAQAFYTFVFTRVNTINGRVYKNDDTIAIISIVGELTAWSGVEANGYNTAGGYIKAVDPNHIVHAGGQYVQTIFDSSMGSWEGYIPGDILSFSNIDCASIHTYHYSDSDFSTFLPLLQQYSQKRNKPWFIEEFGFDQTFYPDSQRAVSMKKTYQQGFKNGSAGHLFWNYDSGVHAGYGVNPSTTESFSMVQIFAKTSGYSPRLGVI